MIDSGKYTCSSCGKIFKLDLYSSCPKCSAKVPDEILDPTSKASTGNWESLSSSKPLPPYSRTQTLTNSEVVIYELVNAQDRTTHAVQSLAYFLFISVCTGVLGYGLIGAGAGSALSCSLENTNCGATGLVYFGWFVIVVGFVAALIVGITHLNKSRVH